ncbi:MULTISPECIES: DUF116 domain-containing protein [Methanococcoides]|jgi:hypothetical protein|uniref:DUF116 domain-containing protein n=1 Tax=Methanococcoides seepicolus TaxID=2828780 RepID=A0A9E4ZF76_9EURY|nr:MULTISPECIES: DUF116 domain-containing protein [Methanococcoides]MCM1985849.1 DUF116 domain-containing protein [Methanococcoides seepicolus]
MYNFIGKLLLVLLVLSVFVSALSLYASRVSLTRNVWLSGLFANVLDFFFLPLKYFFCKFSDPRKLDKWMVSLKNSAHMSDFSKTKKRLMFVPHCMRSLDCPAYATKYGIQCKSCGKCVMDKLKEDANEYGYDLYIVTGSSFVKNILTDHYADGVLVIACDYEINKGMRSLAGTSVVTYGIPMLNDGCYNTMVDDQLVTDTLEMFA